MIPISDDSPPRRTFPIVTLTPGAVQLLTVRPLGSFILQYPTSWAVTSLEPQPIGLS